MPSQADPSAQTLLGHLNDRAGAHAAADLHVDERGLGDDLNTALASQYAPLAVDQFVDPFPDWFGGGTVNESIADIVAEQVASDTNHLRLDQYNVRGDSSDYLVPPFSASTTMVLVDGTEYAIPIFMPGPFDMIGFSAEITVADAASTLRFGLRSSHATQWKPGSVIAETTGSGASVTRLAASVTTVAVAVGGWYWLTLTAQGGTPTIRAVTGGTTVPSSAAGAITTALPPIAFTQTGVTGALPATFGPNSEASTAPKVALRVTAFV